jgi:hypothetical protein
MGEVGCHRRSQIGGCRLDLLGLPAADEPPGPGVVVAWAWVTE